MRFYLFDFECLKDDVAKTVQIINAGYNGECDELLLTLAKKLFNAIEAAEKNAIVINCYHSHLYGAEAGLRPNKIMEIQSNWDTIVEIARHLSDKVSEAILEHWSEDIYYNYYAEIEQSYLWEVLRYIRHIKENDEYAYQIFMNRKGGAT